MLCKRQLLTVNGSKPTLLDQDGTHVGEWRIADHFKVLTVTWQHQQKRACQNYQLVKLTSFEHSGTNLLKYVGKPKKDRG